VNNKIRQNLSLKYTQGIALLRSCTNLFIASENRGPVPCDGRDHLPIGVRFYFKYLSVTYIVPCRGLRGALRRFIISKDLFSGEGPKLYSIECRLGSTRWEVSNFLAAQRVS